MKSRTIGVRRRHTRVDPARFLIRPYALSGSRRELLIAALCIALLGVIFVAEILTPDVVVGAFALLPLLAAMWMVSSRVAALVAFIAILLFAIAFDIETANRVTGILVAVAVLATTVLGRLYAAGVDSVLSSRRHVRPGVKSWVKSAHLDGVDRSPHGLRSLTRRELEVARLAAEGYTAAEVGRRLHIGDRTVESHLGAAYSKLGISSRLQLVRMASRLGAPQ